MAAEREPKDRVGVSAEQVALESRLVARTGKTSASDRRLPPLDPFERHGMTFPAQLWWSVFSVRFGFSRIPSAGRPRLKFLGRTTKTGVRAPGLPERLVRPIVLSSEAPCDSSN